MSWYLQALKKYADFKGRARRKEYWFYVLFYMIILVVLSICDGIIGTRMESGFGILTALYLLAVFIPTLAVTVRRLHDTSHSGWWFFIQLVPIVGFFILLYFLVSDSTPGTNAWGPNPKEGEVPAATVTT